MGNAKTDLREECVRLRVEERLSLREIHDRTKASKGSLSTWLRGYPLTEDEKQAKKSAAASASNRKRAERRKQAQPVGAPRPSTHPHPGTRSDYTSEQAGRVAEAAVLYRLALLKHEVYICAVGNGVFDAIVRLDASQELCRMQVKLTRRGRVDHQDHG